MFHIDDGFHGHGTAQAGALCPYDHQPHLDRIHRIVVRLGGAAMCRKNAAWPNALDRYHQNLKAIHDLLCAVGASCGGDEDEGDMERARRVEFAKVQRRQLCENGNEPASLASDDPRRVLAEALRTPRFARP